MAAFVLGESITLPRIIAIFLAVLGMLIIFGLGLNIPIPNNIGDWLGLAQGSLGLLLLSVFANMKASRPQT